MFPRNREAQLVKPLSRPGLNAISIPMHLSVQITSTAGGLINTFISWGPTRFADWASLILLFEMVRFREFQVELTRAQNFFTATATGYGGGVYLLPSATDIAIRPLSSVASADNALYWMYNDTTPGPIFCELRSSNVSTAPAGTAATTEVAMGPWYSTGGTFTTGLCSGGMHLVGDTTGFGAAATVYTARMTLVAEFGNRL